MVDYLEFADAASVAVRRRHTGLIVAHLDQEAK